MKTLDIIFGLYSKPENDQLEHKGKFIDLHHSKRYDWNVRRHYGF